MTIGRARWIIDPKNHRLLIIIIWAIHTFASRRSILRIVRRKKTSASYLHISIVFSFGRGQRYECGRAQSWQMQKTKLKLPTNRTWNEKWQPLDAIDSPLSRIFGWFEVQGPTTAIGRKSVNWNLLPIKEWMQLKCGFLSSMHSPFIRNRFDSAQTHPISEPFSTFHWNFHLRFEINLRQKVIFRSFKNQLWWVCSLPILSSSVGLSIVGDLLERTFKLHTIRLHSNTNSEFATQCRG